MACVYCEKIKATDQSYAAQPAVYDTDSESPRCHRHWRFVCELCLRPFHYQAMSWCPQEGAAFCYRCALRSQTVERPFWGWSYTWERQCPLCAFWHYALDFDEHQGTDLAQASISSETRLRRHPPRQARALEASVTAKAVEQLWDSNADTWIGRCGPLGDLPRQFSDPVLLGLLGEVMGQDVLDAGCGEGYLCRLLADQGAQVCGVENAGALVAQARAHEQRQPRGIRYLHASIGHMRELKTASMDAIVSNNVFMYCPDLEPALGEFARVLKRSGRLVAVFTHPCFWGAHTDWLRLPPDSIRAEEWLHRSVGHYFARGSYRFTPPGYSDSLIGFQRTLSDYVDMFTAAGFAITHLKEPTVADARPGKLPTSILSQVGSIPISVVFRLTIAGGQRGIRRKRAE